MEITDSITQSLGAVSTKSLFKAEPQYKTIWKCTLLQNTVAHIVSSISHHNWIWLGHQILYCWAFCFVFLFKLISPTSAKSLETNAYTHSHTPWATESRNCTFLSGILFTASTLKDSPALCSLDFNLGVGIHLCVNAQSTVWSLCIDH